MNSNNLLIIGFIGKSGSGKSHAASVVNNRYSMNSEIFSFASTMKKLFSTYINIYEDGRYIYTSNDCNTLYRLLKSGCINTFGEEFTNKLFTDENKNLILKNLLAKYHSENSTVVERINTAKELYQFFGIEMCRSIDQDIWIKILDKNIIDVRNTEKYVNRKFIAIIDDVRFVNEANYIKSKNGLLLKIISRNTSSYSHISECEQNNINDNIIDYIITNTYDVMFNMKLISLLENNINLKFKNK